ncbi:MAG: hypothetical protein ABJH05_17145 [Fulvivirga sp.]
MYNIKDIINGNHPFDDSLHDYIDAALNESAQAVVLRPGAEKVTHMNKSIDLKGKCFVISEPVKLRGIDGLIISNGCIIAGKGFPIDEYMFHVVGANTVKFENLIMDCTKRANGIFFNNFIRVRVEDCTIMHQLNYGIYGNESGNNHELEVVKCNIMEYVFGDGVANKALNEGVIPYFRKAENRTSVGVFLGQADNVIADCNINLCRVGIKVNMRANRIQGNHITAGNTDSNEIYNCIEIDKSHKSACIIVNNYIDNGRIYIKTSAKPIADRNYITISDNLCYRGFNHPVDREFNHIYIDPIEENSSFTNILIQSNQFYTQDANIEGIEERKIYPVGTNNENGNIGLNRTYGSNMSGNAFTLSPRYKVMPMGSTVTKTISLGKKEEQIHINLSKYLPWGRIQSFEILADATDHQCYLSRNGNRRLILHNPNRFEGKLFVKASVLRPYKKIGYFIE